jgi:hypothetical protein
MKLGGILLELRRIDRLQLRHALRRQSHSGRPIGEILLDMGVISRVDVANALLRQPSVAADADTLAGVAPSVARQLPREMADRCECLLLAHRSEWACVAMRDPLDSNSRAEIQEHLGTAVWTVTSPAEELSAARRRVYGAVDYSP